MYDGEYGPGFQKALNMLIEYGEVWDAERLVNVHSAHTGLGGGDWLNEILEGVNQIRAFTTTHAGSVGSVQARRAMGVEEKYLQGGEEYEKQMLDLCVPKGFIPASTCTPYLVGIIMLSSTLSFPKVTFPEYLAASSSIIGLTILHGPHHGAQKSTTVSLCFATSVSKLASVNITGLLVNFSL